ncbi:MAG: UDP-3-O-(3-hydroxymyristoyl)glucosamine N-acyltransferase [Deltaproteobacteria bacterium]
MGKTLREIAELVKGELLGDGSIVIKGVAGIEDAGEGEITFLANPRYTPFLNKTGASAVITGREVSPGTKPLIRTDNPSLAFTKVVSFLNPPQVKPLSGIHPSAVISKGARLGKGCAVGPCAVIDDGCVIGDRTAVHAGAYVGNGTTIGCDGLIYPNVSIREGTVIGDRVIVHSGTVIGSDGFGFVTVQGVHYKIPQTGIVVIGNDVEIGANVTIDRARFDKTSIGDGTKIDNLVQIAHNVSIGKNCLIVALVGIAGSVDVGNNVTIAGQVGVVGHLSIGDNSVIMAKSGISKSVPPNSVLFGSPAQPADDEMKMLVLMRNLPRLYERLKQLERRIGKAEDDSA